MKPTDEQQEIIDAKRDGGDIVIEAGAGTGKSSTLRMIGEDNLDSPGIYIAFNRSVAQEARLKFPGSVNCSTAHSLAYRAVGHKYEHRLNGPRVTGKDLAEYLGIRKWFKVVGQGQKPRKDISSWRIASMAAETVRRFCYSADPEPLEMHVPYVTGVANTDELKAAVFPYAQRIWEDVQLVDGQLGFEHDHYLKIWALSNPRLLCDYVMVDEAQDTNPVLAQIVADQTDKQRILVGDSRQQLFAWRGAVDYMSAFDAEHRLYLTQSFRFGQEIADEANRWLDYLDAPLRLRGLDSVASSIEHVEFPDAILCRTNADVLEQAMIAQSKDVKVGIVGGTGEIIAFVEAAMQLQNEGKTSHRELSIFKTWADAVQYVEEEKPGGSFGTMMRLIQRYGAPRVAVIAKSCVPEPQADRVVATVHKVKGLEWSSVAIDAGVAPSDDESPEGESSDFEMMVAYVAVTRAQHELDTSAIEFFHRRRQFTNRATVNMDAFKS